MNNTHLVTSNLNIIQWNSQCLMPKSSTFKALLGQERIHIAIISETWLEEETFCNINGYNIFRKDRFDSYGGVAILTHKSLEAHVFPILINNSRNEIIGVKLLDCKSVDYVISVYCPASVWSSQSDWDVFSLHKLKTLIAGDFNGHHTNWSYRNDT